MVEIQFIEDGDYANECSFTIQASDSSDFLRETAISIDSTFPHHTYVFSQQGVINGYAHMNPTICSAGTRSVFHQPLQYDTVVQTCENCQYQPLQGQTTCKVCLLFKAGECFDDSLYKERITGECSDDEGWNTVTPAQCEEGAAALKWGDTTATTVVTSDFTPGCFFYSGFLYFNTQNTNKTCSSTGKCLCTLTCPPGTWHEYNNDQGAHCLQCASGKYSIAGASSCPYSATTCPVGTHASAQNVCDLCAPGKYNGQTGRQQQSCIPCGTGKYNDQHGQSSCKSCNTGTYSSSSSSSSSDCVSLYKERTSGTCSDDDGWNTVASAAKCEEGAEALGWGDTTADTKSSSNYAPGCSFYQWSLHFNTKNPNYACSSYDKCLCTLTKERVKDIYVCSDNCVGSDTVCAGSDVSTRANIIPKSVLKSAYMMQSCVV